MLLASVGQAEVARVAVAGAVASKLHNGGESWVRASWARGLDRLGCDVFLIEQVDNPSPAGSPATTSTSRSARTSGGPAVRSRPTASIGSRRGSRWCSTTGLPSTEVIPTA
jgi:hypothetical protein